MQRGRNSFPRGWAARAALLATVFPALVCAQIPAADTRNTITPGTNTHFTAAHPPSLAVWEMRRARLREQILSAAGLNPLFVRTPLDAQIYGRIVHKDYTVEKVLLETLPGLYLGGNLYRPVGKAGPLPGIVSPHGHWDYGRLENTAVASVPGRSINLARQGYVVFTYDMLGYNDTIQTPHDFGGPEEALWSFGPYGIQLWNSLRAVDFLVSLPDVDAKRIGATGASGGATQILGLQAVDERIRWSAPVNMISFIMQGGGACENAPGLRVGTSNVEIAALMAPRPMIMVSDTGDWTKNTPVEEFPAVQSIYQLYGQPGNVETVRFEAQHNYNKDSREAVYRFFARRILGDTRGDAVVEKPFHPDKPNDLLALQGRTLPANAVNLAGLFEEWKAMSRQQIASLDDAALREVLRAAVSIEWPDRVEEAAAPGGIVLGRPGAGDRIPAVWKAGARPGTTLVVDEEGSAHALRSPEGASAAQSGAGVLAIDAFQTGAAVAPRDRSGEFFTTFNLTDDANRVQDILTALRYLELKGPGPITVVARGRAAVWTLFAAAAAPIRVRLDADASAFFGSEREFREQFFVPGILRAGGLDTALRLTRGER